MINGFATYKYYEIIIESINEWDVSSFSNTTYRNYRFVDAKRLNIDGEEIELTSTDIEINVGVLVYGGGLVKLPYFTIEYNTNESLSMVITENNPDSHKVIISAEFSIGLDVGTPDDTTYPYTYLYKNSNIQLDIALLRYIGKKNLVNKSSNSLYYGAITLIGQLTEECDILNPSILIQYDDDEPLLDYNYCNIQSFKRSYWITKITNVRKGLWRIDCHVDVLYSYNADIRKQTGFIERSELYCSGKVDDRIPLYDVNSVVYQEVDNVALNNKKNVIFSFADSNSGYKFVLKTINDVTYIHSSANIPSNLSDMPDIPDLFLETGSVYLMDENAMANVATANQKNDNGASYIISMMYFPCDLYSLYGFTAPPLSKIYSGKYVLDYGDDGINWYETPHSSGNEPTAFHIEKSNTPYLILADFNVDVEQYNSLSHPELAFLNYKAKYELYIPFVGFTELNYLDIVGARLLLMYSIDYDSGIGNAIVYNSSNAKIIFSAQCQIGYQIPINTTNNIEITRQKQSNLTNFMLNEISSVFATGVGLASGNAISAIGGGLGVIKSIGAFINQNNMLFERGNVSVGGSISSFYFPISRPVWKITYKEPVYAPDSAFFNRNGYVYQQWGALTSMTGYTEISQLQYTPDTQRHITTTEISEIEELAKNGIIL